MKRFFIIFKGLILKQIKPIFLKGDSPTLRKKLSSCLESKWLWVDCFKLLSPMFSGGIKWEHCTKIDIWHENKTKNKQKLTVTYILVYFTALVGSFWNYSTGSHNFKIYEVSSQPTLSSFCLRSEFTTYTLQFLFKKWVYNLHSPVFVNVSTTFWELKVH